MRETLKSRFWSKVDKRGPNECWEWLGVKRPNGYGVLFVESNPSNKQGMRPGVHRISWEIHNGPIPKGKQVLHTCDNPSCVNPNHLYLGTQSDNMCDRFERNRCPSTLGGQPKLRDGEVWLARRIYSTGKFTYRYIAKMFKVSPWTISHHIRGLGVSKEVQGQ